MTVPPPTVIELAGPPRVRGQIHGGTLREIITHGIGGWQERIAGFLARPFAWYVSALRTQTCFKEAPELLEEIAGISESSAVDADIIFAWQLADEQGWFTQSIINGQQFERTGCTALGCIAPPSSVALFAQNWDMPTVKDGVQTLLHIRCSESDLECSASRCEQCSLPAQAIRLTGSGMSWRASNPCGTTARSRRGRPSCDRPSSAPNGTIRAASSRREA